MWKHVILYFYDLRILFFSDYSFIFSFSFSYNNLVVKKYWNRICSCITYLIRYAALFKSSISFLMSICLIYEFHKAAQCFMNLLQCTMTCFVIFLIWSHKQINDEKSEIQILFKKTASSLQLMQICIIMKFFIFCNCVWSLTILQLKNLTSSKF